MIAALMKRLRDLVTDAPPIDDPELSTGEGRPLGAARAGRGVEYLQMTLVGKMRAPSFKGIRPDKLPEDTVMEPQAVGTAADDDEEEEPSRRPRSRSRPRTKATPAARTRRGSA